MTKTATDSQPQLQDNVTIPFSMIEIDLEFNGREEYEDIPELMKSIEAHGLITPLTVMKNGGTKVKLVSGYRRYMALQKLAWGDKPVKVTFGTYETDSALYLANIVENMGRKDLKNAELARCCYDLAYGTYIPIIHPLAEGAEKTVGPKLSRKEIARHIGKSEGHVNNLIRAHENLAPQVRKIWAKLDIPLTKAIDWASYTKTEMDDATGKKMVVPDEEKQLAVLGEWQLRQEEAAAASDDGEEKKKAKKKKKATAEEAEEETAEASEEEEGEANPPTKRMIKEQMESLEAKFEKFEGDKLAILKAKHKTLRWVLGLIDKL